MIKLTFCLRRREEFSPEEFRAYWYEKHAPLVKKNAPALGIRRYVQLHSHDLDAPQNQGIAASRKAPQGFDGVAELWWDSAEALAAATATPEGRAAGAELLEDERRFIDLERSPLWFGEEKEIIAPAERGAGGDRS